jgi:hypothetical protein
MSGNADKSRVMALGDILNSQMKNLEGEGMEGIKEMVTKLISNTKELTDKYGTKIMGPSSKGKEVSSTQPKKNSVSLEQTINSNLNVKVDAGNANTKQVEQFLNTSEFREAVFNVIKNMDSNSLATLRRALKLQ